MHDSKRCNTRSDPDYLGVCVGDSYNLHVHGDGYVSSTSDEEYNPLELLVIYLIWYLFFPYMNTTTQENTKNDLRF